MVWAKAELRGATFWIAALGLAAPACAAPRALPVGHCINLGNQLEASDSAADGKRLDPDDLGIIRAAGFDTVRIPVNWQAHSDRAAPHSIDPAWLARVSEVVDAALGRGLNVILDNHGFDALHADPAANAPWLTALWYQIAQHFADRPAHRLWFEIDNEPHGVLTNANLLRTLGPALIAIRLSNPDRPVIIGGEHWSGVEALATLPLPADRQVYPTFHYYQPMGFTHQGATWVTPYHPAGAVWGSAQDRAALAADVAKVHAYAERTGKMPILGETGVFTTAAPTQRVAYTRAITRAFAPLGGGICVWAYTNTFPFYDHHARRWLPGMLTAVGLKER